MSPMKATIINDHTGNKLSNIFRSQKEKQNNCLVNEHRTTTTQQVNSCINSIFDCILELKVKMVSRMDVIKQDVHHFNHPGT